MSPNPENPLNMVSDPFAGDTFVLPGTECTDERKLFFRRMNEIQSFLYVAKLSFDVCKENYEKVIIPKLSSKANTPIKLEMNGGNFIIMPAARIIEMGAAIANKYSVAVKKCLMRLTILIRVRSGSIR